MELKNKRYENIGIHVLSTIFTVDKGKIKILLVKRTNEPFKDFWALPSGALYNDELLCDGAKRETRTNQTQIQQKKGNNQDQSRNA